MVSYKQILLAADLVERDDHAVSRKALDMADKMGATLSIVHAVEYPYSYGLSYGNPFVAEWQQKLEALARDSMAKLGEQLHVPPERRHLLIGPAKDLILQTADKLGAELIVIGSHARHGFDLLLMGSTATAVLHGAKCDILAVRVSHDTPKKHS